MVTLIEKHEIREANRTLEVSIVFFRILSNATRVNDLKVYLFIRTVFWTGIQMAIFHKVSGVHDLRQKSS